MVIFCKLLNKQTHGTTSYLRLCLQPPSAEWYGITSFWLLSVLALLDHNDLNLNCSKSLADIQTQTQLLNCVFVMSVIPSKMNFIVLYNVKTYMSMIKIIPVYFQLQTFFHTYDTQRTVYLHYEKSGPSQHWKYLQTGFPVQYIDWSTRVDTILNSLMF